MSRTRVFPNEEVPEYSEPLEKELRREQPNDCLRLSTYRSVVHMRRTRPTFREEIKNDRVGGRFEILKKWEFSSFWGK